MSGIAFSTQLNTQSPNISCAAPSWVGTPAMDSQGRLEATLEAICKIVADEHASIDALDHNLIASIPGQFKVRSGPTEEEWQDLPSVSFAVTDSSVQNGDHVTLQEDLHIASDDKTEMVYVSHSTSIQGSGNAAYLKVLDVTEEVTQDSQQENTFNLKVTQSVQLAKPWYAPSGIFVSEAKKSLNSSFIKTVNGDASETLKELEETANL